MTQLTKSLTMDLVLPLQHALNSKEVRLANKISTRMRASALLLGSILMLSFPNTLSILWGFQVPFRLCRIFKKK